MAKFRLKNPYITINSVDFTGDVSQVMIHEEQTGVTESIVSGDDWVHNTPSGKGRATLTVTFIADGYAAADVDGRLRAVLPTPVGTSTSASVAIAIRPDGAAQSATNRTRTQNFVLNGYDGFGGGQVGSVPTITMTFVSDGEVTWAP